jgi:hypothetical protein
LHFRILNVKECEMRGSQLSAVLGIVSLTFLGCNLLGPEDGPPPPPDRRLSVEAACRACTPDRATHPCPPLQIGGRGCSGIPAAVVGDMMLWCANGAAAAGFIGPLGWRSTDPEIAAVTLARLPSWHCIGERENAWLEARSPGTATIFVDEYGPAGVVRSVAASVTITPRVD